ncbi:segregation and condensation protein A [Segnochrobactraceae bacterium EtOH-i3]
MARSGGPDGDPPEGEAFEAPAEGEGLVVELGGFEGPLDLLLSLARDQKVDLTRISILDLAEQYLAFIAEAGRRRLELAADYLVMAAWLAYLKSRLLLPAPAKGEEPSGPELAADLAFRLRRLDAMRAAARALLDRPHLGRDRFARGAPEPIAVIPVPRWRADFNGLLTAYSNARSTDFDTQVTVGKRTVWSLVDARTLLERLIGRYAEWTPLSVIVAGIAPEPEVRRTALASSFAATLEMVREGRMAVAQTGTFAPILIRAHSRGSSDLEGAAEEETS